MEYVMEVVDGEDQCAVVEDHLLVLPLTMNQKNQTHQPQTVSDWAGFGSRIAV